MEAKCRADPTLTGLQAENVRYESDINTIINMSPDCNCSGSSILPFHSQNATLLAANGVEIYIT
jgi:hypothetical protein